MSAQIKFLAVSVLLTGMIGLAGCSSNKEQANSATPTIAPTETAVTATTEPEVSPSTPPAETAPSATTSPTETNKDTANAGSQNSDKQLKELLELAKKGKVPGVEYVAHTGLIDEVEADWGKPDQQEPAGKGIYATYTDEHVVFGFNKGSLIFDVRSSDTALQDLTLKQIEGTLGKPDDTKVNGEDKIYTYQANDQFQLKFIIPNSTGKVGHISVFSEQDSTNNMAG
ncbi:YjgB family protein [Paenibacillus sp. G2S3]|uniref:YjgB family protein n=1 Tax=Paenibacillus sp. G2S3 TaxID=3047872 RepID=UPI0024C1C272|nr:YjgB family protein [Paenibacillus sp. G2S3]WHY20469.1 YjgB family protein [Paenibacillus sp. G2S3]